MGAGSGEKLSVAVVGAGIAGLTAAAALERAGWDVTVFEKSRGPGGRSATRRDGERRFDHGAQYFTCRDPGFTAQTERWLAVGAIGRWDARIVAIEGDGRRPVSTEMPRYVGVPGMSELARRLAEGLRCEYRHRVSGLSHGGRWRLALESGETRTADALVLTVPPAQTSALLEPVAPAMAAAVTAVAMEPCWALMLGYEQPFDPGFDAAFVNRGPLRWIAANHSKPGRDEVECWVAHASGPWSQARLEVTPRQAVEALLPEFRALTGSAAAPVSVTAHRWRYARALDPLDCELLKDPSRRLVVAGDWCAGSRIEGAWRSGRAAARALIEIDVRRD